MFKFNTIKYINKYNVLEGYVGTATVYHNGKRLYSISSNITRLWRSDALDDAKQILKDA